MLVRNLLIDLTNSGVKGNPCSLLNYNLGFVLVQEVGTGGWLLVREMRRELQVFAVAEVFCTVQGPMDRRVNAFHKHINGDVTQLV
jgi:hypothetical protein